MSFRPGGDGALWESTAARRRPSGCDPRPRTDRSQRRRSSRVTARCALVAAMVLFVPIARHRHRSHGPGGDPVCRRRAGAHDRRRRSAGVRAVTGRGSVRGHADRRRGRRRDRDQHGPDEPWIDRHRSDQHRPNEHRPDRDADVQALHRTISVGDLWRDAHLHHLDDHAPTRHGRRSGGAHRDGHHEEHGRARAQRTGLQVPARGRPGRRGGHSERSRPALPADHRGGLRVRHRRRRPGGRRLDDVPGNGADRR